MKTIFSLLLLASCGLLANLHADLTVVQKVEGMGQNMESTTKIKPGKTRIDASPANSFLMDLRTGEMTSLMTAQKKYMKIPNQMAQAVVDGMKKMQGDQSAPAAPTPTGKKETVSGYPCEEYTCVLHGTKLTLWLTTALPGYQAMLQEMAAAFNQGPMSVMTKSLGVDFASLPGYPIRTSNELRPGQVVTTTVISVNTDPIPDADFDIPSDYTELKMPSLTPPAARQAPAVSK
jgi:hypothetical protein